MLSFHSKGDGTFETSLQERHRGSSKSLGAALLDSDRDGWLDLVVASDTSPATLSQPAQSHIQRRGGRSRARVQRKKGARGMGVDTGDYDNSGTNSVAITNFDNEMVGSIIRSRMARTKMSRCAPASAWLAKSTELRMCFCRSRSRWRARPGRRQRSHRRHGAQHRGNVGYAQPPQLFQQRKGSFREAAAEIGPTSVVKVGRGGLRGLRSRRGPRLVGHDQQWPRVSLPNDQTAGNRSIRCRLVGPKSNRDGIGATVVVEYNKVSHSQMVKSGSSYLSQSEMPLTFGMGKYDRVDRAVIYWPSGRTEEFKNRAAGRAYECVEGKGVTPKDGF